MLFAVLFVSLRIFQIVTLIPMMGMLAYFVDFYNSQNALTPDSILIMFIVSVLAVAWAVFTLFSYHRSSANARFVSLIDLGFFGALIAAIYEMRNIADADCTNVSEGDGWSASLGDFTISGPDVNIDTDKDCAMLKASWAFAIINCILFFCTAIVAFSHGDRISAHDDRIYRSRSSSHHHRHGHRHRSRSGSHHSSHSRRVYV